MTAKIKATFSMGVSMGKMVIGDCEAKAGVTNYSVKSVIKSGFHFFNQSGQVFKKIAYDAVPGVFK